MDNTSDSGESIKTTDYPPKAKKRNVTEDLQPVLVRLQKEDTSEIYRVCINGDLFKVGRSLDNDEIIKSVWISRYHCTLHYDKIIGNWYVTSLSSTDTLLNGNPIYRNKTEIIKDGDILQLSLSDMFRYKFIMVKKDKTSTKYPRLESNNYSINNVLSEQRTFVESQSFQRKCLEKQISCNQEEQQQMIVELDKLLQDRGETENSNEKLNQEINELQNKIEAGKSTELELQQKYKVLLKELEDERIEFDKKLSQEKQKWQDILEKTEQEKKNLEMSMVEQMEEWKEELRKRQEKEWEEKIENIKQEEKSIQIKLQDEKQILEQKLIEIEKTLEEKKQSPKRPSESQSPDIKDCSVVIIKEIKKNISKKSKCKISSIDLTKDESTRSSSRIRKNKEILSKVNHIMDEQLTCSICSELFINALTLNCTHTFCRYCIDSWRKRRNECPNCRTPIETSTRSLVVDNFIENMLESLTPEQMQKRNQLIEQRKNLSKHNTRKKNKKKS